MCTRLINAQLNINLEELEQKAVDRAIRQLKQRHAAGPDDVPNVVQII